MKKLAYFSKSTLTFNLLKTVLPLVSQKFEVVLFEEISIEPNKKQKPFDILLADTNFFKEMKEDEITAACNELKGSAAFGQARWLLLYPHELMDEKLTVFKKMGFSTHAKPVLAEELAALIEG